MTTLCNPWPGQAQQEQIYLELVPEDIQAAADLFQAVTRY
jgi:hypothetical protein